MPYPALNEKQIDALKEVSNIGAGHAATALSQMTGRPIRIQVSKIRLVGIEEVPEAVGGPQRLLAGIFLKIYGEARGSILLVFPKESVTELISLLTNSGTAPDSPLPEMEVSMLKELGNIMASSYLNAVSRLTKMILIPSVPGIAYDMAGAVLESDLAELGDYGDTALLIETELGLAKESLAGQFFLLPDPEYLRLLLNALEP